MLCIVKTNANSLQTGLVWGVGFCSQGLHRRDIISEYSIFKYIYIGAEYPWYQLIYIRQMYILNGYIYIYICL